ncbi:MAG: DNA polymerase III subunit alpha, partial [Bacteroidales bacterium]|nr:DNA polymerase III subunit alpha [Bacteroidales bacterium]
EELSERIKFELHIMKTMGFPGYFLIVWDFIRKAREMGVLVGPGRGSAAGSAIAYCIGITNVDPIKYDLLFERFLNPGRISMPDIDVDFDDIGRERVIEYVKDKYGSERVSQIITYGTMAAKSSIKDAARVLDLPLPESNRLAGLVPDTPNISLEKAFKEVPQLQEEMEKNPNELVRKTLKYARELEGCIRSVGVHACGMIIAPEDLVEYVPTGVSKDSEMPVTQYEGTYVESVGLLKMDFLGLKTLTIIKDALDNIRLRHGIDIDIDHIPLDDAATYDLFGRGETNGIFQFESDGMKKYMRDLKPNRLEDIIAMNALYRPGPMKYIPQFIDRKFGREKIAYDIPDMEEYLKDTYGITVYQEQVMLLSQKLADFSKSDADTLRKAMGKKKLDVLAKMKTHFMEGCEKHQYSAEVCEKIWTDWEDFASYAFNKSHATCYAWVAYQTAYLKAHYPAEFMASVLTNNLSDITKISFYMEECRRMKINILGPDVNESFTGFTVNKDGAIRFGLSGIKNVGTAVVDLLVKERNENGPYKDVMNFVQRSDLRALNRRCMESLVKAGGFDGLGGITRAAFFARQKPDGPDFIDKLLQYASQYQRNKNSSQTDLFGEAQSDEVAEIDIPDTTPWSAIEQLNNEKEVVGMFISGHPLQTYQLELDTFSNTNLGVLSHQEN